MSLERVEGLLLAGEYQEARREAEWQLQASLPPLAEAHLCQLACRACTAAGDLFAAIRYGERAVRLAGPEGCPETLAGARLALGCACARLGDGPPARQHLQSFLAMLPLLSRAAGALAGEAYYHLSLVYRARREWQRAAAVLTQAAALLRTHDRAREAARAGLDLAGCLLQLGELVQARPPLEAVASYLQEGSDRELALDLHCARALLHRLEGDLEASVALCHQVLVPGSGAGARQLSEAALIMGENAVDLGRPREAATFATLALEQAIRAGSSTLMNRAGSLRRSLPVHEPISLHTLLDLKNI